MPKDLASWLLTPPKAAPSRTAGCGGPGGYPEPLATVEHPLYAKGIVLDDGHRRYVLCAVDWCVPSNSSHLLLRRKMAAAADTDVSRVAVQCVHQHTAPVIDSSAQKLLDQVEAPPAFTDHEFLGEVTDRLLLPPKTDGLYDVFNNRTVINNPRADPTSRMFAARRIASVERLEQPIELSCLQIGHVHIVHLPGEPMVAFQLFAQQLLPDRFVAVAGYGEGAPSNICTERACAEAEEGRVEPKMSMVLPRSEALLKAAIRALLGGK